MLIDSHCHLHLLKLQDNNLGKIITAANNKGIEHIINVATKLEEIKKLEEISKKFCNISYSIGQHPNETYQLNSNFIEKIIKYFSRNDNCIAIGETGLDFHYKYVNHKIQINNFLLHLEAGVKTGYPVIIHSRNANKEIIEIIKQYDFNKFGGILHCFTENWTMAKKLLDHGLFISFSGIVTFKKADQIREVVKKVPIDRILIETDAPYLAPVPYRGKQNIPEYIYNTAKYIAELRKEDFKKFCLKVKDNTKNIFNIKNR